MAIEKSIRPCTTKSDIESLLLKVWCRTFRTRSITSQDRFIWLGGNSLKAMRIITQIEQALSITLPVGALFQHDTIANLTDYIEHHYAYQVPMKFSDTPLSLQRYSLTALENPFYFAHQCQDNRQILYNTPLLLKCEGQLDIALLNASLNALIHRHEALRTCFETVSTQIIHTILDHPPPVTIIRCQTSVKQLDDAIRNRVNQPIALDTFPLLRATLLEYGHDQAILVLVQPHIITDGWSLNLLKTELVEYYTAQLNQHPPDLPVIDVTYQECLAHDHSEAVTHQQREQNYWLTHLSGYQTLSLPYDHAAPMHRTFSGKQHAFSIPTPLFQKLKQFCNDQVATPFMCVAALLNFLLSRYCGQEDILFGFPASRRND